LAYSTKLTPGQDMLVDILGECVSEGRTFEILDAISCYAVANGSWERGWSWYNPSTGRSELVDVFDDRVRNSVSRYAREWLTRNLGICILKGGIIAIPVMNVDHG